jgi:Icc-related predicted phosphoesterase
MNITLLSDLHLEFNNPVQPGEGEVLVLAGDITTVDTVKKDAAFFKSASDNYDLVIYIPGNHEYYHSDINDAWRIITEQIDDRVVTLNDQSVCHNGVHFVGSTLWTDMNKGDSDTMVEATNTMNDYNIVSNGDRVMTALDTYKLHQQSIDWMARALPTLRGDIVMVTHHCPTMLSVAAPGYGSRMPHAYASDLRDFISEYANIRLWCHGHAHRRNDYMVGTTRVLANPCGYYPDSMQLEFDPTLTVPVHQVSNLTCPNA